MVQVFFLYLMSIKTLFELVKNIVKVVLLGIIGFVVDYLYIKRCFQLIKKRRWFSIVNLGLLSITFILFFNLSAYTFPSLWGILFMVFILIAKRSENNYVEFKS